MGAKVFIGNRDDDPDVPLERTEESDGIMTEMETEVMLKVYPDIAHAISSIESKRL